VEECGLARAGLAHDGVEAGRVDDEINAAEGRDIAPGEVVRLVDVGAGEEGRHGSVTLLSSQGVRPEQGRCRSHGPRQLRRCVSENH